MREFTVGKNDAGQRADRFISKAVPNLPNGKMYKFIREKKIKLNGKRCEISTRLCEGDILRLYIPDEFFGDTSAEEKNLDDIPSEVTIIYEDENILLAYKPTGLVVHEDSENTKDTLINRITKLLIERGEYDPSAENSFAPALCNRLDRNTEGIVVCAKNAESLRALNGFIRERKLKKKYLCAVLGSPRKNEGRIKTYLEKVEAENTVYVREKKTPNSKTAITDYRVLKTKGGLSLVEVGLVTGRTHQIRVHLAYIGCPILGDGKYDREAENRRYKRKSQRLCAYSLGFDIPRDGPLGYLAGRTFKAPTPRFVEEMFGETD